MLFAETGLSPGEISSLFAIWSVTGFVVEIPSGMWADLVSRRRLLVAAPLLAGAGFALWTFAPSHPAFALGFVLWGAGGALRSGTLQALVYEELERIGAADHFARLMGRAAAVGTTAVMAADALAAPVLAVGGHPAAGIASVAVTVLGAVTALSFPESRRPERPRGGGQGYLAVLRSGLAEVRRGAGVRRALSFIAALSGIGALEEYLPLLAWDTGVPAQVVPLLVLLVGAGTALGGWFADRAPTVLAPALALAAACLMAGAASRHPAGFVLVAAAYGLFQWATATAEARLQDRIADEARATVTSIAGLAAEVVTLLVYLGYAAGSVGAPSWLLFTVAAVPYLVLAVLARGGRGS